MAKAPPQGNGDIDWDLYSRQAYTLGEETMYHIVQMNVLIVGMTGLGVEIG